jgi:hypothetical protein
VANAEVADIRPAISQLTERGIGGTGIVGVITGFASVCVDGLEVAYDNSAKVDIDGTEGTPSALRAGQIVVIQAKGSTATPVAQTISVRRQVTGRIESIELGTGTLTIAGQAVSVPAGTWGADTVRLGDWVAVSGLRRTDGMLIASRLDLAPAGAMTVRGQVTREGDTARIGELVLNGAAAADLKTGQYVIVSGQYVGGRPQVHAVAQDALFSNPASYFGTAVNHLVLQAFVRVANGAVYLNGLKVAAGPGVSGKPGADGVAIVSLERKSDGSFTAVGLRYTDHAGSPPGAVRVPAGTSRGTTITPPQARRPVAQMMALTGNAASSGAGPTVATTATMSGPAGTGPVVTIPSTGAMTSGPTTTLTPPATIANAPPASIPPPPVIIPPPSVTILPPTTAIVPPVGSGAKIESVTPITSQLMSSLTGSNNAIKPASLARTVAAFHPAVVAASIAPATVSLATEAVTAPTVQTGAGAVKTPAVLAPPSSRSGGIRPIGAGVRNVATGGTASLIR